MTCKLFTALGEAESRMIDFVKAIQNRCGFSIEISEKIGSTHVTTEKIKGKRVRRRNCVGGSDKRRSSASGLCPATRTPKWGRCPLRVDRVDLTTDEHRSLSMLAYVWRRTRDTETSAALSESRPLTP